MYFIQAADLLLLFIVFACTPLVFLFCFKLLSGGNLMVNKIELAVLTGLCLSVISWAAAQLNGLIQDKWVEYLAFNLIAVMLTIYIKVLGARLTAVPKQQYFIYGVLVYSAMNIWTMVLVGPGNALWQFASVLGSCLLILGNAGIIFQISRKSVLLVYRVIPRLISLGLILFAGLYLLSMLNHFSEIRPISLWVGSGLVMLLFLYSIDNVYYYSTRDLHERIDLLREEYAAEMEMVEDVVLSLARTIDAKDRYTQGHTERVSQYSIFLGERLGLNEKRLETIRVGALIHDIGKLGIDQDVLNKPGKLNEEERMHIESHPLMGIQICSPLKSFKEVEAIIRSHHEKLDGSGYPDGLFGDQISLETRIVTISDIFDALTTERSYRPALTAAHAIEIMKQDAQEGKLDKVLMLEFEAMLYELGVLS